MNTLSALIHGESKAGKTWAGATTPTPRLYLDVESRSKYAPLGRRVEWQPHQPIPDTTDIDTVVVKVREDAQFATVLQWLQAGNHPFQSVVLDSVTEMQKRLIDKIAGANQMETQDWGTLLRDMEIKVRQLRDLTDDPVHPIPVVLIIAGTDDKSGKYRPMLQGALAKTIPYHCDMVGFLATGPSPDDATKAARYLYIQPIPQAVAGDGTDLLTQHYGPVIVNPDFTEMLSVLNGAG